MKKRDQDIVKQYTNWKKHTYKSMERMKNVITNSNSSEFAFQWNFYLSVLKYEFCFGMQFEIQITNKHMEKEFRQANRCQSHSSENSITESLNHRHTIQCLSNNQKSKRERECVRDGIEGRMTWNAKKNIHTIHTNDKKTVKKQNKKTYFWKTTI